MDMQNSDCKAPSKSPQRFNRYVDLDGTFQLKSDLSKPSSNVLRIPRLCAH